MNAKLNKLNILIVRTDRIGDVILSLPTVSVLKSTHPDCNIVFLTKGYTFQLVAQYQGVDEVIEYQPDTLHRGIKGHKLLATQLKKYNFDWAFLLFPRVELLYSLKKASIPDISGSSRRWYSLFLDHKITISRKKCDKHELEYNLDILSPLIKDPQIFEQYEFNLNPKLAKSIRLKLHALKVSKQFIIIHSGNGGSAPNISVKNYQKIILNIINDTKVDILLTGSTDETEAIENIIKPFSTFRIKNVAGKFDLTELMAVINEAKLLIATSTGPIHIASSLNVPVLGFYCHAKPHLPKRWGPYYQTKWAITPDLDTSVSCKQSKCPHQGCLRLLPKEVIEKNLNLRLKSLKLLN